MTETRDPTDTRAQDVDLARRALRREPVAIDQLCRRLACVPRIISSLSRRSGYGLDAAAVDDVAQDAVVKIWEKLGEYEGRASLETWFYRFAFLTLMNYVRKSERRDRSLETQPDAPSVAAPEVDVLDFSTLVEALEELGPPQSDALRLRYFEDLKFGEIAVRLNVSATSAKNYVRRGVARLREMMGDRP